MWLPISTVAVLWIICKAVDTTGSKHNELENIFRQRSRSDWEEVWHSEKHTRCREKVVNHLYWACEKDIYRITRRSSQEDTIGNKHYLPWLPKMKAQQIVRSRRGGSSITTECCSSTGCTWEEYAEYCPTNKRHTVYIY